MSITEEQVLAVLENKAVIQQSLTKQLQEKLGVSDRFIVVQVRGGRVKHLAPWREVTGPSFVNALCGAVPNDRGWEEQPVHTTLEVTCARCLRRYERRMRG